MTKQQRSTIPLVTTTSPLARAALLTLATIEGGHRADPPIAGIIDRAIRAELERIAPGAWIRASFAPMPAEVQDATGAVEFLTAFLAAELTRFGMVATSSQHGHDGAALVPMRVCEKCGTNGVKSPCRTCGAPTVKTMTLVHVDAVGEVVPRSVAWPADLMRGPDLALGNLDQAFASGFSHKAPSSVSASEALIEHELAKRPRVPPPEHLAGCQLKACAPGCPVFAAAVASRKTHNADPKAQHGIAIPIDRPPQPDHVHKPVIQSPSDISSLVTSAAAALGKLPGAQ